MKAFLFDRRKRIYAESEKYIISNSDLEILEDGRYQSLASISVISNQRQDAKEVLLAKVGRELAVIKFVDPMPSAVLKDDLLKMSALKHENLNTFLGVCIDSENPFILMLYASRGSLYDVIHSDTTKLSPDVKQSLILDIALGMKYLHLSVIGKLVRSNTSCRFYNKLEIIYLF